MPYDMEKEIEKLGHRFSDEIVTLAIDEVLKEVEKTGAIVASRAYELPTMRRLGGFWERQAVLDWLTHKVRRLCVVEHPLSEFMQHQVYVLRSVVS